MSSMKLHRNLTFGYIILVVLILILLDNPLFQKFSIITLSLFYFIYSLYYYMRKHYYLKQYKNAVFNFETILYNDLALPSSYDSETSLLNEAIASNNLVYRKQLNELKQQDLNYKEFIELWIHEIKTPLSAIYLLNQNEKIEQELERINNHLNFALYYAKSNDVSNDFFIQSLSLKQIIFNVVKKHRNIFISKNITPVIFEEDVTINTDQKWVEFVLLQIVDNALKYSNSKSKIEFSYTSNAQSISLFIHDEGIGIPAHDLPQVFNKGFTGSHQFNEKSTGFGLYLVKKICDQLHHPIQITSENGTIVRIDFPLEQ